MAQACGFTTRRVSAKKVAAIPRRNAVPLKASRGPERVEASAREPSVPATITAHQRLGSLRQTSANARPIAARNSPPPTKLGKMLASASPASGSAADCMTWLSWRLPC